MVKIATLAGTLAAGVLMLLPAATQRPLPGVPMTAPPVNHPALAAQPLMRTVDGPKQAKAPQPAAPMPVPKQPDPDTQGVKCEGKQLAANVKRLKELEWHKALDQATEAAEANGKPILWLQTLGDLTGFA